MINLIPDPVEPCLIHNEFKSLMLIHSQIKFDPVVKQANFYPKNEGQSKLDSN